MNSNKLSIGLLIALVGFPQISETIYTPALPNVAYALKASIHLVEATLSIYFLGFALGVLLWGTISDIWGRRTAMLAGILGYGIGTFGCANAGTVEALLVWRFLQAFGASTGSVVTQTILRDAYSGTERTKLFSVMSGALAFFPALGPVLGGFISEFFGWRANFWVLASLSVFLALWSFFSLPETRPKSFTRVSINKMILLLSDMLKSRPLWGHILLIGAANGILFGFYQEAPFVFIEQLGMKPSYYGFFGLLIASGTILAARISYWQSMHFSAPSIIKMGSACVFMGGLGFTFTVLVGISEITGVGMILTLFLIFFGIGLIIPNSLSHALKNYHNAAGTAASFFGGLYYCIIAGFTWIMSAIHNRTALPLPIYITILGLILLVGTRMIRSPQYVELIDI